MLKKISFFVVCCISTTFFPMQRDINVNQLIQHVKNDINSIQSAQYIQYQASEFYQQIPQETQFFKNNKAQLETYNKNYNAAFFDPSDVKKRELFEESARAILKILEQSKSFIPAEQLVLIKPELKNIYEQYYENPAQFFRGKSLTDIENLREQIFNFRLNNLAVVNQVRKRGITDPLVPALNEQIRLLKAQTSMPTSEPISTTTTTISTELQKKLDEAYGNFLMDEQFLAQQSQQTLQDLMRDINQYQQAYKEGYEDLKQVLQKYIQPASQPSVQIPEQKQPTLIKGPAYTHFDYKGLNLPDYVTKEIDKARAAFDANEQKLDDSAQRILWVNNQQTIFSVRSIQQFTGWHCGHFVLFNADILEKNFKNLSATKITAHAINNILLPRNEYNYPAFKNFYNTKSIKAYSRATNALDPFTGMKTVASIEEGLAPNFLDDQDMVNKAQDLGIVYFYTIGRDPMSNTILLTAGTKDADIYQAAEQSLRTVKNKLPAQRWVVHTACQLTADHWILISALNPTGKSQDAALIILDSQNNLMDFANKQTFVDLLSNIFLR